jgi:hypothetical protein
MSYRLLEKCREAEREIFDETQGNKMELVYYLLTSETDDYENDSDMRIYGIEIVKKVQGLPSESIGFENVHSDKEKIKKIIALLAENTVTPVSLPDILDDLL